MIKVETMSIASKKGMWSGDIYTYIRNWAEKNQSKCHFKLTPDRNSIVFYNEEGFEHFKKTFEKPWRRIY